MHHTPTVEELLPNHKIQCVQLNCEQIFSNVGNYEMHLQRHHKIMPTKRTPPSAYHCPIPSCIYNAARGDHGKHFGNLKYLRQHYQKVHYEKTHVCENCGKKLATARQLLTHQQKECGRKFICDVCGWSYDTMEALQTHAKRKGHAIQAAAVAAKVENMPKKPVQRLKTQRPVEQQTQTEAAPSPKRLRITSVQTEPEPAYATQGSNETVTSTYQSDLDEIHALLRDIETQTDATPCASLPTASNVGFLDQMLGQSSHMHTQTCDDFLTELGLTDIQTQTNWSSLAEDKHQYTSIATSTGGSGGNGAHDELLVSTETQTSFTQCLLDSCNNGSHVDNGFGSLYNTQQTQTCETLLDTLSLFGGQDTDLMTGFQSTYTQT